MFDAKCRKLDHLSLDVAEKKTFCCSKKYNSNNLRTLLAEAQPRNQLRVSRAFSQVHLDGFYFLLFSH